MGIVAKQSGWIMLSGYVGTLLGALNAFLLFPMTFPDDPGFMGVVRWMISTAMIVGAFAHWGWPQAMVTWLPKIPQGSHRYLLRVGRNLLSLTLLVLLLLGYWLGDDALSQLAIGHWPDAMVAVMWLLVAAYVFFELYASQLIHRQEVILPYVLKDSGRKLSISILLLLTMFGVLDFQQMIAGIVISFLLQAIWVGHRALKTLPPASQETVAVKPIVTYALTMVLTSVASMMFGQLDILMIGAWLGMVAVAHYAIAFNFGIVVAIPMKAMNASLRPIIAKLVAEESWEELKSLGLRSLASQWMLSSFIFLMVLTIAPWMFAWLPPAYQGGESAVLWVSAAQLIHVITGPSGLVLVTSKLYRWGLFANGLMLAVAFGLGYYWIPDHGVVGASQVFFVAVLSYNALKLVALYRLSGHVWMDARFLLAFAWTLLGLAAWLAWGQAQVLPDQLWTLSTWMTMGLHWLLGLLWFAIALYGFKLAPDVNAMIRRINPLRS